MTALPPIVERRAPRALSAARRRIGLLLAGALSVGAAAAQGCAADAVVAGGARGDDDASGDDASAASTEGGASIEGDAGIDRDARPGDGGGGDARVVCSVSPCAVDVTACYEHACAVMSDGSVRCWGSNENAQVGSSQGFGATFASPFVVAGLPKATRVVCGNLHTCALGEDGSVWCWGDNYQGELGGSDRSTFVPAPRRISGLHAAVAEIYAGMNRTCARLVTGEVQCLGSNDRGILGTGSDIPANATTATTMSVGGVTGVTLGFEHTCVSFADGGASCVGYNGYGQLGRGPAAGSSAVDVGPVLNLQKPVRALGDMQGDHQCAVLADDTAACWGANAQHQVAADAGRVDLPHVMDSLTGVEQIAGGFEHSCAVLLDGSVSCWGGNADGKTAVDAATTVVPTPRPVVGLTGPAVKVSASFGSFSCALLRSGAVMCWGTNLEGELGRGQDAAALPFDPSPARVAF